MPHGLKTPPERRGRPLHYTDMAITAALMIKRECNLPHRALQGLINPTFKLMALPLQSDFLPTRLMYSHTPFATSVDTMRYHQ
ncbi:transposase [Edwardsiella ictaluri]|nr:transposase [Edwardsiella ictaluri]